MKKLIVLFITLLINLITTSCDESNTNNKSNIKSESKIKYDAKIIFSLEKFTKSEFAGRMEYEYHIKVKNFGDDKIEIALSISPITQNGEKLFCLSSRYRVTVEPKNEKTIILNRCGKTGPPDINQLLINLRDVYVNGKYIGIEDLELSSFKVKNEYDGIEILYPPIWSGLVPSGYNSSSKKYMPCDCAKISYNIMLNGGIDFASAEDQTKLNICNELFSSSSFMDKAKNCPDYIKMTNYLKKSN